jgi:hypothetical protein
VDKYGGGRSSSEQLGYGPVQGPGTRLCIEAELGEAEEIPRQLKTLLLVTKMMMQEEEEQQHSC